METDRVAPVERAVVAPVEVAVEPSHQLVLAVVLGLLAAVGPVVDVLAQPVDTVVVLVLHQPVVEPMAPVQQVALPLA